MSNYLFIQYNSRWDKKFCQQEKKLFSCICWQFYFENDHELVWKCQDAIDIDSAPPLTTSLWVFTLL